MSFMCHLRKCNFALLSVAFIHFVSSGCSSQTHRSAGIYASVWERDVSHTEKEMNTPARVLFGFYCASLHTSKLQAVKTILTPHFSCTVSLNVRLLSGGWGWVRGGDYVQRLERGGGRYKSLRKSYHFSPSHCIIRCIPSRIVDQNILSV